MKKLLLASILAMTVAGSAMATEVAFVAGVDKSPNSSAVDNDAVTKDGITITVSNGVLGRTDNYRCYKGQTMTVTSTVGAITSMVITSTAEGDAQYGAGCFTDPTTGTYSYAGNVGTWTGSATEFTLTASKAQVRMTQIVITYDGAAPAVAAPTITGEASANGYVVTLRAEEGNSIYYTLDGTTPNDASTLYTAPFELTESATVKAIAYDDNDIASSVTSKTFTVEKSYNTAETALTVAEANAYVAAGVNLDYSVYTKGTVKFIKELSTSYGNATYSITDGTDTLLVYRGYGLDGVKFTDAQDLLVGDQVVICGKLVDYSGTYEYTTGSKIVSQVKVDRPSVDPEPEPEPYVPVGNGTLSNPYIVADVLGLYADGDTIPSVWVKGIIKGAADGALNKVQTENVQVPSNLVLTDESGKIFPVALASKSDHRAALNLVDNPSLLGTTIYVKGDILKYFSQAGVKNVTDWSFDGQTSGIRKVTASVLDSNEPKVIFDILGKRVTTMKRPGIYIVNGKKVVLK